MQTITPITPDETLLVSGTYHYNLGANDTFIREPWTIHELRNADHVIRVERDATVFNATLLTEITMRSDKISGIEIHWKNTNENIVQEASASYHFEGNELNIERICDGTTYSEKHSVDKNTLISPLMRIGIGFVLTKLVNYPDGTTVLIPNITKPQAGNVLLGAYFDQRKAKQLAYEPMETGGKLYQTTCFQYTGDLYDEDARFWLDKYKILLRYTWKQSDGMTWDVQLHDYIRFDPGTA